MKMVVLTWISFLFIQSAWAHADDSGADPSPGASGSVAVDSLEQRQDCEEGTGLPAAATGFFDRFLGLITAAPTSPGAEKTTAPGAVILVTGPGWTYCGVAGVTESGGEVPIRYDTPFEIGSNTKMMTAVVLLQLQEEGRLGLDDRLSEYLPEIATRLPHGEKITLRQMANHTSGIYDYTEDAPNGAPGIIQGSLDNPAAMSKRYTPSQLVEFAIKNGEPNFSPGSQGNWKYSNTGYVLLGMIIEQVTGKPLESLFEKRIFVPLEMDHTFFWNDVPRAYFGLPASYWSAPFEVDATSWNMSQAWAAGAVISTAPDMATFMTALMQGRLFSDPGTLGLMEDAIETGNAVILRYGIGLNSKAPGVWGHGGQTIGFQSDVAYMPDEGVSIVAWGNSGNNLAGAASTAISEVVRTVAAEQ